MPIWDLNVHVSCKDRTESFKFNGTTLLFHTTSPPSLMIYSTIDAKHAPATNFTITLWYKKDLTLLPDVGNTSTYFNHDILERYEGRHRCLWYWWGFQPAWWRHQMEAFSALLAICAGNSPVTDEFPAQRPVTRSFDAFFDLHLNKRLSKQSRDWWLETPSSSLWRHRNAQWLHIMLKEQK